MVLKGLQADNIPAPYLNVSGNIGRSKGIEQVVELTEYAIGNIFYILSSIHFYNKLKTRILQRRFSWLKNNAPGHKGVITNDLWWPKEIESSCNRYRLPVRYGFLLCIVSGYEFRELVCLVSLCYVLFQDTSSGDL